MLFFFICLTYLTYINGVPYNSMENVTPLDSSNFTDNTANGRWIIIFFRKSCGHCIAFSEPFSEAAVYAKNWSWAVRIGAIDCEEPSNNQICWKYKIQGVPTIELFADGEVLSEIVTYSNVSKLLEAMVHELLPEIKKISDENRSKPRNIIFTSSSGENNARLMLDFAEGLKLPVVSDVLPTAPVMTVKTWSGMIIARGTFEEVKQSLYILTRSKVKESNKTDSGKDAEPHVGSTQSPKFTPVYAADIFRSLSMLLSSDVSARVNITGEDMDALKEFIDMLIQTLPASVEYSRALHSLKNWLFGRTAITGQEWYDQLRVAQLPVYTGDFIACKGSQPYLRGYPCGLWLLFHTLTVSHYLQSPDYAISSILFRPLYPTGAVKSPPGDLVAHAMHRFMPRFFSCLYCAYHFALNSANLARPGESLLPQNRPAPPPSEFVWDSSVLPQLPAPPKTARDEVIWLNIIHNRVNKRLSGSPTDDPTAPKVVFPTAAVCSSCWSKDASTGELTLAGTPEARSSLFNFLVTLYRPSSWHTVGLPPIFFSSSDAQKIYPIEIWNKRSNYSDLFTVAILSVILTAFSLILILFLSRFLWRYRRGRRNNIV